MRSPCSCRWLSGSTVFGLYGKRILRPLHNSVECNWLTGQFPSSKCLGAGTNQYARSALSLAADKKSIRGCCRFRRKPVSGTKCQCERCHAVDLCGTPAARPWSSRCATAHQPRSAWLSCFSHGAVPGDKRASLWPSVGSRLIETKVVAASLRSYDRVPAMQACPVMEKAE